MFFLDRFGFTLEYKLSTCRLASLMVRDPVSCCPGRAKGEKVRYENIVEFSKMRFEGELTRCHEAFKLYGKVCMYCRYMYNRICCWVYNQKFGCCVEMTFCRSGHLHRITGWLRLERTSGGHHVQPLLKEGPSEQDTQAHVQAT